MGSSFQALFSMPAHTGRMAMIRAGSKQCGKCGSFNEEVVCGGIDCVGCGNRKEVLQELSHEESIEESIKGQRIKPQKELDEILKRNSKKYSRKSLRRT